MVSTSPILALGRVFRMLKIVLYTVTAWTVDVCARGGGGRASKHASNSPKHGLNASICYMTLTY